MNGKIREYEDLGASDIDRINLLYLPIDKRLLVGSTYEISYVLGSGAVFQYYLNHEARFLRIIGKSESVEEGERELIDKGIKLKLRNEDGN